LKIKKEDKMAQAVVMPRQGQSVESCILSKWYKQKGDQVKAGEILFAYETDKASFEEEAKEDGILLDIFFQEEDDVPVLINIAVIGKEGEDAASFAPEGVGGDSQTAQKVETTKVVAEVEVETPTVTAGNNLTAPSGDSAISPRAKKLAEKSGVIYNSISGTGPYGRIIERDIEAAIASGNMGTPLAGQLATEGNLTAKSGSGLGGRITSVDLTAISDITPGGEVKKISNMRKIISQKMLESLQNTAQLTLHISADARNILNLRKQVKIDMANGSKDNVTINDMVCYAVCEVLKKFPDINSHFLGDKVKEFGEVHLGLAVDTERGLMVPTIRNADQLRASGLSSQIKDLAGQCRTGSIDPELLQGATFTITNLGAFGIEMFTPVLNPPQVGILGVNTITHRPVDIGGGIIGMVPYIGLSLTFDHRAIDGAPAALFLKTVKEQIEALTI
jgi:pyruvate dehydrogenase E2 component (dihydrolipoyllysine-residue acetyltransferase)